MSNERNIHSASRPRRRMGPGRGMVPGEKAKDLKGALGKILRYMGKYKIAVVFVMIIAACSTVFSVLGPKVLGKATTGLAEGLMAKVAGTGSTTSAISVISGEILSIITSTPMMVAVDVMIWVTLWFNPIPSVSTSFVILDNTSP